MPVPIDPVLDRAPCAFATVGDDGFVLQANTTLAELVGESRRRLIGTHVDRILTPASRIFYQTHVFPTLKLQGSVEEIHLVLALAGGEEREVMLAARRVARHERFESDWVMLTLRPEPELRADPALTRRALQEIRRGSQWSAARTASVAEPPSLAGVRVLVVEDDEPALESLSAVLRGAGAHVAEARDVADALSQYHAHAPQLLLSDLGMAGGDGYALIRRIREIESTKGASTPAIAITGHVAPDDHARALAAGFDLHMAKPVDPADLLATAATLTREDTRRGG